MRRIPALACLIALLSGAAWCTNVTVFSFKESIKGFKVPPAIRNFTALYKTELSKKADIQVLERENLADITSEMALGQAGFLDSAGQALDPALFEGVDFIIGGTITQTDAGRFRVDLAIREVKTAKIIAEKISGNIEKYNEAAAEMLAANTACLLTGQGGFIRKKIMPRTAAFITAGAGAGVAVAGLVLRLAGRNAYDDYEKLNGTLDEFEETFDKAQNLTTAGEICLFVGGAAAVAGTLFAVSGRRERTLTRE